MSESSERPAPRIAENWPRAIDLPAGSHRLCGCRNSTGWPYCDGAQPRCETAAHELDLKRPRFVWMCQCGETAKPPFCDGDGHIQAARRGR